MAKISETFDEAGFTAWLNTRPESVKRVAEKVQPNRLYRMGVHRCYLFSYSEDGTVSVVVDGQFNRVLFSRKVFGVNPDDLVECDLPSPGEDLGDTAAEAGYTEQDVREILIPKLRAEGLFDGQR